MSKRSDEDAAPPSSKRAKTSSSSVDVIQEPVGSAKPKAKPVDAAKGKAWPIDAAKIPVRELERASTPRAEMEALEDKTPAKRQYPLVDAATGRKQDITVENVEV